MNDRSAPRCRPSPEFSSRRLPSDLPLRSIAAAGERSTRAQSSPYSSSSLLARQPWRDPREDGIMDFDARLSGHPRRPPIPRSERRPPFGSTMLGDGHGDRKRPYPDECDELSPESHEYGPRRHGNPERFASLSDIAIELEAPPGAPSTRRGDGDRGHVRFPDHRGTPPKAASWRPRTFRIEHSPVIDEDRVDSVPFPGGCHEPSHPSRRGPNREDFQDIGEECSPPPRFRQRPGGCVDFNRCPPDSIDHQDGDHIQRAPSDYCKQPVPHRDYGHLDSYPDEQERDQECPGVPYYDKHPPSFSGLNESPFRPCHFEGSGRATPAPRRKEPLSQGTRPASLKGEERGEVDHGTAPRSQERQTVFNPSLPNLQQSRKGGEAIKPERQESSHISCSYRRPNGSSSAEADPPNSGIVEKAIDTGCPRPKLPITAEDRAIKFDQLQNPINAECKAQLPLGFRPILASSQELPTNSIPPVQLTSHNIAVRAPLGPVVSQHTRSKDQTEPASHQRPPISGQQQPKYFPRQDLLASASTDLISQSNQSLSFTGRITQVPTQSAPQKPRPTCLENVDRPFSMMEAGGLKEDKLPSMASERKLQPPPSSPWRRGRKKQLGYQELNPCFQNVAQADKCGEPQYHISSGNNDAKPSATPMDLQPPDIASKVSSGPRKPYGPDYPDTGQQYSYSVPLNGAASLPTVSLLPERPPPSPLSLCAANQKMTTTSANVTQIDMNVATSLKSQQPRPLPTAYNKVSFSLPPPLLGQPQACFPAYANQEGSRTDTPYALVNHAKTITSAEPKLTAVSPTIATTVPQPPVSPIYLQGKQAATAENRKQCSPASDCQVQKATALPSSKLGGNVEKLNLERPQSTKELYGPEVPNPVFAVQFASTNAQGANPGAGTMDLDADCTGLSGQSERMTAKVGPNMLPMKTLENYLVSTTTHQADFPKKNEVPSQNSVPQMNSGLKKQQPLIVKHAANQKESTELKIIEVEHKKQEPAEGNVGHLSEYPDNPDPLNPSKSTSEAPSICGGSDVKNSQEGMANRAASLTNKSTSAVKEDTLNTKKATKNNSEILLTDEDKAATNKEASAGNEPALNDQEVSSSTPECSDEGTSVREGSKEPNANSINTVDGTDSCDKDGQLSEDSDALSIEHDVTSGSGESDYSYSKKRSAEDRQLSEERNTNATERDVTPESEDPEYSISKKSNTKTTNPSPGNASARGSRTYSSDDDNQCTDTETRSNRLRLPGRGNGGQIFGIPVVFQAISGARTFWSIRSWVLSRDLEEIIGDNVVSQKLNRAGFLCVNVATTADAVKLLNIQKLGGLRVEAVIPSMYLRHEAKIRGVPYHYTNAQLVEHFSDVGVVDARRQVTVKRQHDGSLEEHPRSSVILTFKPDATLPRTLELGPDRFVVEEYIEAPVQCLKCLRFGHTAGDCVSVARCKNCGARYCVKDCKRRTPVCANCFGPHPANYGGCPRRREVAFASLWSKAFNLNAL